MRIAFCIIFDLLIIALACCAVGAYRSHKENSGTVACLMICLIPPMIGNLLIIASSKDLISTIGYYIYFIGMDFTMFALLRFAVAYCGYSWRTQRHKYLLLLLLTIDVVQILLNPVFGHTFSTMPIMVERKLYYRLVPYAGQVFHRVVCYGIFFGVLIIFFRKNQTAPRSIKEKYQVILWTMVIVGLWETFYIFSGSPIDRSMIGFGAFGILVYYFAIRYRPVRLLDQMLAQIAQEMPDALFFYDARGICIWANQSAMKLVDAAEGDFQKAGESAEVFSKEGDETGEDDWTAQIEISERYYVVEKRVIRDKRGIVDGFFLNTRDNTRERQELLQETYTARHDALTGLYNRQYLYRRTVEMIRTSGEECVVVFVDVKEFKVVNDIFGNAFGDYVLQSIAQRISDLMPENSVFGRLGGDTFGICLPTRLFDEAAVEEGLAHFTISTGSVEHQVLIHLGVYQATEPELDVSVMYDRAKMALSTIESTYQTCVAWYDEEMRRKVLWEQEITTQLPQALKERQIRPFLQPLVDERGKVVGAEALVRWYHPQHGLLSPASFIPVFEKNGMIAEVDRYMWRCACELLQKWEKENDLFISVNVSPKDFYFMNVEEEIRGLVQEFGVTPCKFRIEITETVMMSEMENRMRILDDLKRDGFLVEIDDFGSGYSSFNMLKDMPVDVLKIDMAFLRKTKDEIKAAKIVHNIISMSEDLGIVSLTEGVETKEQYEVLSRMGCRLFQGYYFAKPMPEEDFERYCKGA